MSKHDDVGARYSEFLLLLVPMLWGLGYPLIRGSMGAIDPLGFLHLRFLSALLPLGLLFRRELRRINRQLIIRGTLIGIALFFAYAFLNWGLVYTTTAKAGFIIGLRVILVPAVGALLFHLRARPTNWAAALLSLVGLTFIFFGDFEAPLILNPGDVLITCSAFFFAVHVLLVGRYVRADNYAPLLLLQLAVVVLLSAGGALIIEERLFPAQLVVWPKALAAGLLSTALAFWLQNRYQHYTSSDQTGVIFSSEPLFAALFGFIFLGEILRGWQWIGAALIVQAMVLALQPKIGK